MQGIAILVFVVLSVMFIMLLLSLCDYYHYRVMKGRELPSLIIVIMIIIIMIMIIIII